MGELITMFWSLKAHFDLALEYMDTSYHLGWQTRRGSAWQAYWKLWFTIMPWTSVSSEKKKNVLPMLKATLKAVYPWCLKGHLESSVSCSVPDSLLSVLLMSSCMCKLDIKLLFRTTCGTEILCVINSKMALNLFALVHVQHTCVCTEGFW